MEKNKKITIIVAAIIVIGMIVTLIAKFNVDMMTRAHKQVQLDLNSEFNVSDVKEITNEVFNGQTVEIQKVEVYEKQVLISTNKISDDQKNDLITKINEKYGTEISKDDVEIVSVPKTKLSDIVTKYIWTFVLITILIVLYMLVRYRKIGTLKVMVQTVLGIIILELLVMSIIAIVRIPIGVNLPSIMFVTYVVAVFALTTMYEKELKKIKAEEAKNKKK